MYLMYVDESGDPGLTSKNRFFVLSGLVIHELRWKDIMEDFLVLRKNLRDQYGLKLREEIHAGAFISKPGELKRIPKYKRLEILRRVLDWAASKPELSITTIVVNKNGKRSDIFEIAWQNLIQRFETTIARGNFPPPKWGDDKGLILPDNTNGPQLTALIRRMRHYNPIPNVSSLYGGGYRNLTLRYVIEDPFMKDSSQSYYHQIIDVVAYFARQKFEPNSYFRKRAGRNYYDRLGPILNTRASTSHPQGIVFI